MSGLRLNIPKTHLIPLWDASGTHPEDQTDMTSYITTTVPQWHNICLSSHSKYLGFMSGPGKNAHSWDKPFEKYKNTIHTWCGRKLGINMNMKAYNVYCISILGFISQLEDIPDCITTFEQALPLLIAPGPYFWASIEDLWYAKTSYNQAIQCHSISKMATAAKIRISYTDAQDYRSKSNSLTTCMNESPFTHRIAKWSQWYHNCHYNVIRRAREYGQNFGICGASIWDTIVTMGLAGEDQDV